MARHAAWPPAPALSPRCGLPVDVQTPAATLHSRKRDDIVDEMNAEMISNGFVVVKPRSRFGVAANTYERTDTADASPVRSSRWISNMTL